MNIVLYFILNPNTKITENLRSYKF